MFPNQRLNIKYQIFCNSPRAKFKIFIFLICIFYFLFLIFYLTKAAPPEELKTSLNKKSQELQEISAKIRENQKNLEEAQSQSRSLEKGIRTLDATVREIGLGIEESEIITDKLNLEIESLGYTIEDAQKQIESNEKSIIKIIQAIQEGEAETPLIAFLKNKSLAESVFEAQSLSDLHSGLTIEIDNLKKRKEGLSNEIRSTSDKKSEIEIEAQNLKNKKIILAETKQEKQNFLRETKNREQVYQKLLSDLEKRQGEIALEIETLEQSLRQKIDPAALPQKRPGVLALPTKGVLSQDYGATKFARYGYRGKWHNGVDFAAPIGTSVFSAEKGRVLAVADQDRYCPRGAYGKFIVIEHENNLSTLYAHLSLQTVKKDDIVEKGQLIGYVGKTGYATGPHLHLTVYASQTFRIGPSKSCGPEMPFGGDLNPMDYL
ncbi:peptidoglycan DD-metalloendopeptidase family protein [Candidatus Wolfebacteria bacterium]|nr:peptidoglycan DD-metalloendopeptidase family protein [Candidatus Wolfebacteria bacterium]